MQRMLSQHHSSRSYESSYQEAETEPPKGVESEDFGVCQQSARNASYGCGVRGNLEPYICYGADYLYEEGSEDDDAEEMREMEELHEVEAEEITRYGYDVRHHSSFPAYEFQYGPSLIPHVEMYEHRGQEDGEEIDHSEDEHLVLPMQEGKITEEEQ